MNAPPLTLKNRSRLDLLLVEKGLAKSRHQAQALILAGQVKVEGDWKTKAGTLVSPEAEIVIARPSPYVGRGGYKLERGLDVFGIDPAGKICLDVGASTGGFTDCLLQRGAKKVYAVDVGKGQLAWRLRRDPRVVCLEQVNARYLSAAEIPEPVAICTVDVSFISVKKILPPVLGIVASGGEILVLVKPQFEAGREEVKKGIVRDEKVHGKVLSGMAQWSQENGYFVRGVTYSPLKGGDGNIEFFLYLSPTPPGNAVDLPALVSEAHRALGKTP